MFYPYVVPSYDPCVPIAFVFLEELCMSWLTCLGMYWRSWRHGTHSPFPRCMWQGSVHSSISLTSWWYSALKIDGEDAFDRWYMFTTMVMPSTMWSWPTSKIIVAVNVDKIILSLYCQAVLGLLVWPCDITGYHQDLETSRHNFGHFRNLAVW